MALAAQTSRNFAIWRSTRVRSNGTEAAIYRRVLARNRRDLARPRRESVIFGNDDELGLERSSLELGLGGLQPRVLRPRS